jgi:hypothetical protein
MTTQRALNSMSLPPPTISFVSKLVFGAIAIAIAVAASAAAPRTVTIPIAIVLAAGIIASGLMKLLGGWRARRRTRAVERRRLAVMAAATTSERQRLSEEPSEESMRELGWLALGAVSIAILMLAIVLPDELALAFAAIGFAGLVVFRLTGAWVGWVPERKATAPARVSSEVFVRRRAPMPRIAAWRSDSIRGRPPRRRADDVRGGTSSRLASS